MLTINNLDKLIGWNIVHHGNSYKIICVGGEQTDKYIVTFSVMDKIDLLAKLVSGSLISCDICRYPLTSSNGEHMYGFDGKQYIKYMRESDFDDISNCVVMLAKVLLTNENFEIYAPDGRLFQKRKQYSSTC